MDRKTQQVTEGFNAAGVDFILTEPDTAITLCDVAMNSRDPHHALHDVQQAKRALQSALHFLERVRPNDAAQKEIAEKTSRLQLLLKQSDQEL